MVDFVFGAVALIAIFGVALTILVNLYLRNVMTNAATDAARLMARADVSSSCQASAEAMAEAIARAHQGVQLLTNANLVTAITANVQQVNGLCTSVVSINANLPGLPVIDSITNFFASAHATLEFQQ